MIKKIWNALGSIKFTFWLLMVAAVLFLIGSISTDIYFPFFKNMSETRIQDWIIRNMPSNWQTAWWLPAIIAVLFLLGINTVICTASRIAALVSKRNAESAYQFTVALIPSVIHILFIIVLSGHVVTMALGKWIRMPLDQDAVVTIDSSTPPLTATDIRNELYPDYSLMRGRVKQTTVTLRDPDGKSITMSYLDSIGYHGYQLHLDMIKDKRTVDQGKLQNAIPDSALTCNKSDLFSMKNKPREGRKKLFLLAIYDPGLPVIITAFSLILAVMTWYFIEILRKRNSI